MTKRIVIVVAAYVAAQMMADIASLRIVLFLGMSIDSGTFVYPLTFTLRDLVHKTIGKAGARALIVSAAVINVVMAGLFWLVAQLPADPSVGPQAEFAAVLAPVWRIVFASIAAEVIAELVDTEVYDAWVKRMGTNHQWARVLVSNAASVPLDSLLFCWLAFGGVYPVAVVWSIVLANIVIKGATTLISIPLIYAVPEGNPNAMVGDMPRNT